MSDTGMKVLPTRWEAARDAGHNPVEHRSLGYAHSDCAGCGWCGWPCPTLAQAAALDADPDGSSSWS